MMPYSVSLSPDDARAAATSGASLLLLDVPPGTIVGIDHRSFIAGPNFKGVKMIPTTVRKGKGGGGGGAHFVATNATGKKGRENAAAGPTNFFFFHACEPGAVTVRRWSPEHEVLVPLDDEDEEERYAAGVRRFDFDAGLAPYDLGSWALWQSLTRFVSPRTTARVAPPKSSRAVAMSVVAEAEEVEKRKRKRRGGGAAGKAPTEAERRLDEQLERGRAAKAKESAAAGGGGGSSAPEDAAFVVVPDVVGAPRYAELPRHAVVARGGRGGGSGVVGREKRGEESVAIRAAAAPPSSSSSSILTAANLDKTSTLRAVVRSAPFSGDAAEFLGEFQHAFVSFWAGHSLLAFGAWRDCLRLVLGCEAGFCLPEKERETAAATMEVDGRFFREFVDALSAQISVATTATVIASVLNVQRQLLDRVVLVRRHQLLVRRHFRASSSRVLNQVLGRLRFVLPVTYVLISRKRKPRHQHGAARDHQHTGRGCNRTCACTCQHQNLARQRRHTGQPGQHVVCQAGPLALEPGFASCFGMLAHIL